MQDETLQYEELKEQIELRDCVLRGMDADIYVSDLSSHAVLYTNRQPEEEGAGNPLVGRICWEALKGRNHRCESCPITYLLKNPGKSCLKKYSGGGGQVLSCDKIIPWPQGKLVHLHYTLDISE